MNPLFVKLGLHAQEFTSGMRKAQGDLAKIKGSTTALSRSLDRLKTTAISAFSFWGIKNAIQSVIKLSDEQDKAEKKLKSVIKSTGGAAQQSLEQMKSYARYLQSITTYGDEAILNVQSIVATFTNIKSSEFDRVVKSVLNLTDLLGSGDTRSAALQLGKALNDPVANLGALSRAGIQFSKDQKEVIKSLWESGEAAKAQMIILDELEKQFGGTAEATRDTFGGSLKSLSNTFGDFLEKLGDVVTKNEEFTDGINRLSRSIERIDVEKVIRVAKSFKEFLEYLPGIGHILMVPQLGSEILKEAETRTKAIGDLEKKIESHRNRANQFLKDVDSWRGKLMGKDVYLQQYSKEIDKIKELTEQLKKLKDARTPIAMPDTYLDWQSSPGQKSFDNIEKTFLDIAKDIRKVDSELNNFFRDLDIYEKELSKLIDKDIDDAIRNDEVLKYIDELDANLSKLNKTIEEFNKEHYNQFENATERFAQEGIDWDPFTRDFEKSLIEQEDIYKHFLENIQDAQTDAWKDFFKGNLKDWKDYFDTIRDLFIDVLAEMASASFTKKLNVALQGQIDQGGIGIGNLFGNNKLNYAAAGLSGYAIGSGTQSYWAGAAGGAASGYMAGGYWGALIGGASGLLGAWGSNKNAPNWRDTGVMVAPNQFYSGVKGSEFNLGQFGFTFDYTGGGDRGEELRQWTNELVKQKNTVIGQYLDILNKLPSEYTNSIKDAVNKIDVDWGTEYHTAFISLDELSKMFVEKYNKTITNAMRDQVYDYLTKQEGFQSLEDYVQQSLLKPHLPSPQGGTVYFETTEDILNALQYVKEVNNTIKDIGLSSQKAAGYHVSYKIGLKNVNDSFDSMIKTLQELGVASKKIQEIESKRIEAINYYNEQVMSQRKDIIDQWKIISGYLTEEQAQLLDLEKQYQSAFEALQDLNASDSELNKLTQLYNQAANNIKDTFVDTVNDGINNIKSAWSSFFDTVMNDLSPVQSSEYLGQQLSTYYAQATTEEGITNLLNFVQSQYLPFMKAYGGSDYNILWENIRDLTGSIMYNGQTIGGINYDQMGVTIGEYVSNALLTDDSKIIIQIGDKFYSEILLSELRNNNPELVSEIRRIANR